MNRIFCMHKTYLCIAFFTFYYCLPAVYIVKFHTVRQ